MRHAAALAAAATLPRDRCIWDESELLLKASVEGRDQSLTNLWVRSYLRNMVCYPRLNVVSDNVSLIRHRFAAVPNASFHQLHWPQPMLDAGLGQPLYSKRGAQRVHGLPAVYFAIQWPMMWADNFTVAKHILVLDTDTIPVLPIRCHHLFDDDERPVWHTWSWPKPPAWLRHVNAVFNRTNAPTALRVEDALAPHADFMTFFPVIIPRALLGPARDALARAYGTHFDDAWLRMKNPSYGDLLGKTAALLMPGTVNVTHCPAVGRMKELIPAAELSQQTQNGCRDLVTVVEHVKHPFRDCHTGHCHHLSRASAVQYGQRLLERAAAFRRGDGALPWELYHYQSNRSAQDRSVLEARIVKPDTPGRICGVPPSAPDGVVSTAELTSSSSSTLIRLPSTDSTGGADPLVLLVYDNRYNSSVGPLPRHLLYRSAAALGVPVLIGSLVPAAVRRWQPGDRELWLMRTLPTISARLAVLLDGFDTVLMCKTSELVDRWRHLAGGNRILISTEKQLWPEEGVYQGAKLSGAGGAYPKPPADPGGGGGAASRYINIGALVGKPASLLALLQCMSTRYASFPYQCPIRDLSNGSYSYVSTAPFRTRRIGFVKGNWGWEQACFHTYLMEQSHGALPPTCPHLVLDYRTDFVLNFNKIGPKLVWPWGDSQRMLSPFTKAASCVLHANGASKYAMPVLHYWWDRVHAPERQQHEPVAAALSRGRDLLLKNFSRSYVEQWLLALKPQGFRESSAILMLKDALRDATHA
jgi:hypothetical protein